MATMAGRGGAEPLSLHTIHEDALFNILLWLRGRDVARIIQVCSTLRAAIRRAPLIWTRLATREFLPDVRATATVQLSLAGGPIDSTVPAELALYRAARAYHRLTCARWSPCIDSDDGVRGPGGVEGHSICTWRDRWIVCAGGWCNTGLSSDIYVLDTQPLEGPPDMPIYAKQYSWVRVSVTGDVPYPTYGYSLSEASGDRIVKYGGCVYGGYHGVQAWCHVCTLSQNADGQIIGHWTKLASGEGEATYHPAAYHSAVLLGPDRNHVLIFGGMTDMGSTDAITVINISTGEGFQPQQECVAPCSSTPAPRYGAAVHVVGGRLWVLGGCDGVDLRRDGIDHQDIACADVGQVLTEHTLMWLPLPAIRLALRAIGREASSVTFGSKIIIHAGTHRRSRLVCDRDLGNKLTWFDTKTLEFGCPRTVGKRAPFRALSSEAVRLGRYMYVFGGWSERGLIEALFQADLGLEKSVLDTVSSSCEEETLQQKLLGSSWDAALPRESLREQAASGERKDAEVNGDSEEDADGDDDDDESQEDHSYGQHVRLMQMLAQAIMDGGHGPVLWADEVDDSVDDGDSDTEAAAAAAP